MRLSTMKKLPLSRKENRGGAFNMEKKLQRKNRGKLGVSKAAVGVEVVEGQMTEAVEKGR